MLVPRLYRYKYDPNPRVQLAMSSIWAAVVPESKKAVSLPLPLPAPLSPSMPGREGGREGGKDERREGVRGREGGRVRRPSSLYIPSSVPCLGGQVSDCYSG